MPTAGEVTVRAVRISGQQRPFLWTPRPPGLVGSDHQDVADGVGVPVDGATAPMPPPWGGPPPTWSTRSVMRSVSVAPFWSACALVSWPAATSAASCADHLGGGLGPDPVATPPAMAAAEVRLGEGAGDLVSLSFCDGLVVDQPGQRVLDRAQASGGAVRNA